MSKNTTEEARRALVWLASAPVHKSTLDTKDLKSLLLDTDGQIFMQGRFRRIKTTHIGAGVHSVETEAIKYD